MNAIVCIPHPDDEIFALPLFQNFPNLDFKLIQLTNGDPLGDPYMIQRRSKEFDRSIEFLRKQGYRVSKAEINFAGKVFDGSLYKSDVNLILNELMDYVDLIKPTYVFAPAFEGGHQDHDAAALISYLLAEHCKSKIVHFSTYRASRFVFPLFITMRPREAKLRYPHRRIYTSYIALRLILVYRSQFSTFAFLGLPIIISYLFRSWFSSSESSPEKIHTFLYEQRSTATSDDLEDFGIRLWAESGK